MSDTTAAADEQVENAPSADTSPQGRFTTFGGVFTPCVLTILGVIMFMRAGTVVGESGFIRGLLILLLAKSITTMTALSLSAIATNTDVKTGGVYFMISRTLGPDFGGAIGLTLFISQAISIAFYVIGFSEALFGLFAPQGTALAATLNLYRIPQLGSSIVVLLLFAITFRGADAAIKTQYFILGALLLSVLSFLVGGIIHFKTGTFSANLGTRSGSGMSFWVVFAIFFPAATGITAGANMSGDLKNPAVSIPRGTLFAIIFTAIIYLLELVLLAGFSSQSAMAADPFGALKKMSVFMPLVVLGVFAATLSSALGSFLGAPRILQAMGQDRLLPFLEYFGKGEGPTNEPRRATVLSLLIALAIVWAGGLNTIAQIISMFFLIAYGMINLSAFVEGRGGNPSFRPRFKIFGWPVALAGAIACGYAMFKIDETYAVVSVGIAWLVYLSLKGRVKSDWNDAKRGYIFSRIRQNLLLLESSRVDAKNWRPALMTLTDDCEEERDLICSAAHIESRRGILSVLELRAHGGTLKERHEERHKRLEVLRAMLHKEDVVAFADSVIVEDPSSHFDTVLQSYSIGSLRPNTVMLPYPGDTREPAVRARLVEILRTLSAYDLNVVVHKRPGEGFKNRRRKIDLWWAGQGNGPLMAIFAYLATTDKLRFNRGIRLLRVVRSKEERKQAQKDLEGLCDASRINMSIKVVMYDESIFHTISETSRKADLVFLGLSDHVFGDFEAYMATSDEFLRGLPETLLVHSARNVDLMA